MKVEKLSASAYNTSQCLLSWYSEYILGWRGPSSLPMCKGTIFHSIMEVLAQIKLRGPHIDENIGEVAVDYTIEDLTNRYFDFHSKKEPLEWKDKDRRDVHEWVDKFLKYNGGAFDPRNLDIVGTEVYFSIGLPYEWAKTYSGGQLKINGFIDLVTRENPELFTISDYKTGNRINWSNYQKKEDKDFKEDIQLLIYYWAAHKLYPKVKDFIVTIIYPNDGGAFPIFFDKSDIAKVETRIQKKFEQLQSTIVPAVNKSSSCGKICFQNKSTFEGTYIEPIIEFREGQFQDVGQVMCKCSQTEYMLKTRGVEWVEENMSNLEKKS